MTRNALALMVALLALAGCTAPGPAPDDPPAGTTKPEAGLTCTETTPGHEVLGHSGEIITHTWIPKGYANDSRPLFVVFHPGGKAARLNGPVDAFKALADRHCVLLLFPEIPWVASAYCSSANGIVPACTNDPSTAQAGGGWPSFDDANQHRDGAYPRLLAQATRDVAVIANVDVDQTFVVGWSSGGMMAGIMAVTYPDVFPRAALVSTGEYNLSDDPVLGPMVAFQNGGPDPDEQGGITVQEMGAFVRPQRILTMRISGDSNVSPKTGYQTFRQWVQVEDWIDNAQDDDSFSVKNEALFNGTVPGGHAYQFACIGDPERGSYVEELYMEYTDQDNAARGQPAHFEWPRPEIGLPDATAEIHRFFATNRSGCEEGTIHEEGM